MADTIFGFGFRIFAKNQAKKPTEEASKSMDKLANKVKHTGEEAKNAHPHVQDLNKGMTRGAGAASKMKGAIIALVAAIGTMVIIRKIGGLFGSFIKQGIDTENQILVLQSITGDAVSAFNAYEWAVRKAAETPFEIEDIIQAFTQLEAYGLDARNSLDLVGNMALSMGKSIDEAVNSIAIAAGGRITSLREQFAVSAQQVNQWTSGMEKGTEAYKKALIEGLKTVKRFQGGMERAQNTAMVAASNIEDWWSRMKMALAGKPGEGLLGDAWKNFLKNILGRLEAMEDRAASVMRGLGKVLSRVIGLVSQVVGKAFDWLERWINKTGEAFENQKEGIYPFILWLTLAFGKVKGFFESFMIGWNRGMSGIKKARELMWSLFPDMKAPETDGWSSFAEVLGQVASGFVLIADAIKLVGKAFEGWKWIIDSWDKVPDWAKTGISMANPTWYVSKGAELAPQTFGGGAQVPTGQVKSPEAMRAEWAVKYGPGEGNKSVTYGDINIDIKPQPGDSIDPGALSKEIVRQINEQSILEAERGGQ